MEFGLDAQVDWQAYMYVHLVHGGATAAANSARVPQRLKQHWRSETANNGYVKRHSGDYPFLNARGVK